MKLNRSNKIIMVGLWMFSTSAFSNIDKLSVSPDFGLSGSKFNFTVTLSKPVPKDYKVQIDFGNGNLRSMIGSGTQYNFSQKIYNLIGKQNYIVGIYDSKGVLQYRDSGYYLIKSKNDKSPILDKIEPKTLPNHSIMDKTGNSVGFRFTKISSTGEELSASATNWYCVKDNVSGLAWEVKTADFGLHDWRYTYSWYNPNNTYNGGDAGTQNGGNCANNLCNTDEYVKAVNSVGYCGYSDWRLPTIEELHYIVDYEHHLPSIDTTYFSDLQNAGIEFGFWSSSPYADGSHSAWTIVFYDGYSNATLKRNNRSIRLVRH